MKRGVGGRLSAAQVIRQDVVLANREIEIGLASLNADELRARVHSARRFLSAALEKLRKEER